MCLSFNDFTVFSHPYVLAKFANIIIRVNFADILHDGVTYSCVAITCSDITWRAEASLYNILMRKNTERFESSRVNCRIMKSVSTPSSLG